MVKYYDDDVISCLSPSIVLSPFFEEWFLYVEDILINDEFQKRKLFMHHHNISVWEHSILVSFKSFVVAKYFNADARICAIAGLLHDFYTKAWIKTQDVLELENGKYFDEVRKPLFKKHGFTHASDAANNYVKYFPELKDKKITNSIKRHMFPLNIVPPRYKEGYIITIVDKFNSMNEMPSIKNVSQIVVKKTKTILKRIFVK